MQVNMAKAQKSRASKLKYMSPMYPTLLGFETPFEQNLNPNNRWVILSKQLPWDLLVSRYQKQMRNSSMGADGINPRVAIGSIIIKHMCNLSDRETVQQIQENIYMQYFIGFSSFSNEEPFDHSLFVEFRKRLTIDDINYINEEIVKQFLSKEQENNTINNTAKNDKSKRKPEDESDREEEIEKPQVTQYGKLILDATACPQDIAYPTDINILNDAREKSEQIIDRLHDHTRSEVKPRTYREKARKDFLKVAQKKSKTKKQIRIGIRQQLQYLNRNIKHINRMLDELGCIPLDEKLYKYLLVIQTTYQQQKEMFDNKSHRVDDRIVSIHQPQVRPIVRGKTNANVEFGSKIQVSLVNGFVFLDDLSWDAFNEGTRLISSVEKYKNTFGFYPQEVLADKIYCNRENRAWLKTKDILLKAKPLGRPPSVSIHLSPGERNPIEGKFGQAKTSYGLNRIKARLRQTSESWIATIIMVLNLVKLAGKVLYCINYGKKIIRLKYIEIYDLRNINYSNQFHLLHTFRLT